MLAQGQSSSKKKKILLWNFASRFIKDVGLQFSCTIFVQIFFGGNSDLIEIIENYPSPVGVRPQVLTCFLRTVVPVSAQFSKASSGLKVFDVLFKVRFTYDQLRNESRNSLTTLHTCFSRLFIFHDLPSTFQFSGPFLFGLPDESWGFSYLTLPSTFCDCAHVGGQAKGRQREKKSRRGLPHPLGTTASLIKEEGSLPQRFRCLPTPAATARRPPSCSSGQDQRGLCWSSLCLHLIPSSRFWATLSPGWGIPEEKRSTHYQFSRTSSSCLLPQSTCHYLFFRVFKQLLNACCPGCTVAFSGTDRWSVPNPSHPEPELPDAFSYRAVTKAT